jgi:hypothetical protein
MKLDNKPVFLLFVVKLTHCFFVPGLYETHDFSNPANLRDVFAKNMYSRPKGQCEEFVELAPLLNPDLQMPWDADSTLQLCTELNDLILRIDLILLRFETTYTDFLFVLLIYEYTRLL